MDLVADMMMDNLRAECGSAIKVMRVRPKMVSRFGYLPAFRRSHVAYSLDRLLNRFCDYPRHLAQRKEDFDLYHIVDHSYAHLVHHLPAERSIVNCYDLDTFRCLLEPEREPRSKLFRMMTQRILDGFRRAARVICASAATRDELLAHRLLVSDRARVIKLGIHPECAPKLGSFCDPETVRLLETQRRDHVDLLHVGTTVARKRIDVLLHVVASSRRYIPSLRLIRVGSDFTRPQQELVDRLDLKGSLLVLPFLNRRTLAAIYARAALLLQPSEREGFGLPVVEAMACGTPVVASDLPALREMGGPSSVYCPVADVSSWTETLLELLRERSEHPAQWNARRLAAMAWASRFSWREHARQTFRVYQELLH
ncbi:MAG TPA: glycosyltransferase family 1 protein [Candidatus Binataceae bacterium]|nr:glycosyltransferase family 1 protein [Candidatus Binataceae bacterium]